MMIRAAKAADLPTIKLLWNDMIANTNFTFTSILKTDSILESMLHDRADRFLVADVEGRMAGFVTWGPFRGGDGYVHTAEHSIITATAGTGIGRALMLAAMEQARAQGIHTMVAGIGHENTAAVAFHIKLGFGLAGRVPEVGQKNGRWHDLILMHKTLTKP